MPDDVLPDHDDSVALAAALRPALLRVTRRLRQEANKEGLSALDALLLGEIKRRPGVGICDLADQEQISRPTMSGHVKRFEASGWIVRAGHAKDGRRSGLSITPAGVKALEAIRRRRNDWLAVRLAKLPADERRDLAAAARPLLELLRVDP